MIYRMYKIYKSDLFKAWVVCMPGTSFIVSGQPTLDAAKAFVDRYIGRD